MQSPQKYKIQEKKWILIMLKMEQLYALLIS